MQWLKCNRSSLISSQIMATESKKNNQQRLHVIVAHFKLICSSFVFVFGCPFFFVLHSQPKRRLQSMSGRKPTIKSNLVRLIAYWTQIKQETQFFVIFYVSKLIASNFVFLQINKAALLFLLTKSEYFDWLLDVDCLIFSLLDFLSVLIYLKSCCLFPENL